jgi:predicted PurR-regulated permease PerM
MDMYLDTAVLDTMVLLTIPASLFYSFIINQVRNRLCWRACNFWSVLHTLAFLFCFISAILYVIARPRQAFNFMYSLIPSDNFSRSRCSRS